MVVIVVVGICVVGLGVTFLLRGTAVHFSAASVLRRVFVRVEVHDQRELVEAIAVWTENLRDSISSTAGIEQAITTTSAYAPTVLVPHTQRLVASLKYSTLDDALIQFADSVAHPTSDFVVASLLISTHHHTRDLSGLLTHLSECARAESDVYTRIWVSRARTRTAVRIIKGSVVAFSLGLVILHPSYLQPFFHPSGLIALSVVIGCQFAGLFWLQHMTTFTPPPRFLTRAGGHP